MKHNLVLKFKMLCILRDSFMGSLPLREKSTLDVCGGASLVVMSVKFANVATIEIKCLFT